jgi:predicted permease
MESILNVLKIVAPIFATIGLGILARKKNTLSEEQIRGLQQFVMSFCLPCVVFNSCLSASFGMESLATMGLVMPMILLSSVWSFRQGKKIFPYHNMPMLFSAQESGMLGIPLFMTLFGAANVYRMGVLDLAQSVVAIPVIAKIRKMIREEENIEHGA